MIFNYLSLKDIEILFDHLHNENIKLQNKIDLLSQKLGLEFIDEQEYTEPAHYRKIKKNK